MDKHVITVSIIGVGARGAEVYGRYIHELKDKFKIVNLCDPRQDRIDKYKQAFDVPEENCFLSEEEFFKEKRSDVLLICTQDQLHVRMAKRAIELGYNILLEKPISDNPIELKELDEAAKKAGTIVMVCHVLRYTAMILKLKEIIDSGEIGQLISIDQTENVAFWHQAHSFVRGNWRKREECTPMIMAKCCHDFDLLQYFAKSKCKYVSSMGDLTYFKRVNKPQGSAERCLDCKYQEVCPYSAQKVYIDMWKSEDWHCSENIFPMNVVTDELPLTEEKILKALKTSPYGRCVFACDNNVVDHQTTIMQFENGVTATLKMEAFTETGGRDIRFFGTYGELTLLESERKIVLKKFYGEKKEWNLQDLTNDLSGHGGGDHRMIDKLYEILTVGETVDSSLENSIESHYMALAAEESRLNKGAMVEIKKYRN